VGDLGEIYKNSKQKNATKQSPASVIKISKYQLSNIKYQISIINYQISNINYQISNIKYQISIIVSHPTASQSHPSTPKNPQPKYVSEPPQPTTNKKKDCE